MKVNEKKIAEVSAKLDKLLEKAGQFNKYQFLILILFTFQFILAQFFNTGLFFLSSKPYVKPKQDSKSVILNRELCDNKNYDNDYSKTGSSIVLDFKIECDWTKTYFISISLYIGMFIGSFISYIFADRIGRKKSLVILYLFIFYHYFLLN